MNNHAPEYVAPCRAYVRSHVATFSNLATATDTDGHGKATSLGSAVEGFEPVFVNNMVIVLDASLCHRSGTMQRKDGNPLTEVRMLSASLMGHDGLRDADNKIKLSPATSVPKHNLGDEIRLSQDDFARLADALFLGEIDVSYG